MKIPVDHLDRDGRRELIQRLRDAAKAEGKRVCLCCDNWGFRHADTWDVSETLNSWHLQRATGS